jgi:hypothetical protein
LSRNGGIDRRDVLAWLADHDRAWRSNDAGDIAALFAPDAVYHTGPWDETWRGQVGPFHGPKAIAAAWVAANDPDERFTDQTEILAIDGRRTVVWRRFTYVDECGGVENRYDTCWVLDFDDTGRCREYREWYVEEPRPAP